MTAIEGPQHSPQGGELAPRPNPPSSSPDTLTVADAAQFADLPICASVNLAEKLVTIGEVLSIEAGAILNLAKKAASSVDLVVGDILLARGELVGDGKKMRFRIRQIETGPLR